MNKVKILITLLTIGILGVAGAFAQTDGTMSLSEVDVNGQVGYESSYVFRGVEVAEDVATVSAAVKYNKVYLQVDSFWGTKSGDFDQEIDLTAGILVEDVLFNGTFLELGAIGYFNDNDFSPDTTEFFVGYGADLYVVDVDGYVYYDIDRESFTAIASVTNTLQLTEDAPVFGQVFLVTRGEVGFVNDTAGLEQTVRDFKYGFASVSSDLVVVVKDAEISIGARYNFSDDEDAYDINDFSWGASVGYSF